MRVGGENAPWPATAPPPPELVAAGAAVLAARPTEIEFAADGGVRGVVARKAFLGETIDYRIAVGDVEVRVQKSRHAAGPARRRGLRTPVPAGALVSAGLIPPDRGCAPVRRIVLRRGEPPASRPIQSLLGPGGRGPGYPLLHNRCLRRRAPATSIRTTVPPPPRNRADGIDLLRDVPGPATASAGTATRIASGPTSAASSRPSSPRRSATSRASSTTSRSATPTSTLDDPQPDGSFPEKTGRVILSGGEALIDPVRERVTYKVIERAERDSYAAQGGVRIVVQTTGDLLTDAIVDDLLARGVWMISVASVDDFHVGLEGPDEAAARSSTRLTALFERHGMRALRPRRRRRATGTRRRDRSTASSARRPTRGSASCGRAAAPGRTACRRRRLADNFCNRWSGGLNFLRHRYNGSEVSVEPDGAVYPVLHQDRRCRSATWSTRA